MKSKLYLGDSVYASHDGYNIWLTTENGYPDDPRNEIALEPAVFRALVEYDADCKRQMKAQTEAHG